MKVKKMKRKLLRLVTIVVMIILQTELCAQIDTLCEGGSTTVMNGEYNVMNNVWGASTAQCITVDLDSSYFKVTLSEHNSSNVASYPAIFKGCHWGWCTTTNNPLPMQIKNIESAPFTWTVNTENAAGTWNTALDIWFAPLNTGYDYSAELMIWIDYNGGAAPAGSQQATVEIGELLWNVYFVAWSSWNYIAYRVTGPVDSVSLDLRDFIHDAITRGYLYTPWYLHAVEAGFEIWSDGQGLTSNSFSADVIETSSPVNYAPLPFRIQSPPDGGSVDSLVVAFKWQKTVDPDLDSIEYILHLIEPQGETTFVGLDTNYFVLDGNAFLENNTTYTWYVEATDKIDTTISTTQRTFVTPMSVGVDLENQLPNEFSLYQNYPNPFNPSTKISYSLQTNSKVRLSIYDPVGREVAFLIDKYQNAGKYELAFSGKNLTSGIYFYKLQTVDGVLTKKMILVK
jgi:hypothetical protein